MARHCYDVGDTITYYAFGGERRTGVVTTKSDDIKNGEPGFVLDINAWGYDDQIVAVERRN